MSSRVSAEVASEFIDRFLGFDDAVIRRIVLELTRSAARRRAVIDVMARDRRSNEEWVICSIEVLGLAEYLIQESPKGSYQVLSDGLKLAWQGHLVFLDFGTSDEPNIEEIRSGGFFFAGNEVKYTVREPDETDLL
jgi:hypothetical protein